MALLVIAGRGSCRVTLLWVEWVPTYEDSCRDVATTTNGNHEIGLELIEDLGCCLLT